MNAETQQEASPYPAEKSPVTPSLAPLQDSSKECNMHLLANAVDHVMYHPPISTSSANLANMPAAPVQQQHGIITTHIGRSSSSPFQPPANIATTTSRTMNVGVGLVPVQNYSSPVQTPNSSTSSANYLPSESSHTLPLSVSSMQDGVSSKYMTPSSMSLPSHNVHSASSSYVSGSIKESPSSSQYVVGTTPSSVFSPAAGTIHRPTNSMQGITTMLQPSFSELPKPPSSLAQKDPQVMPSGSNVLPAEATATSIVSNISLPASDPLYIPMSSLQSNVMMSSSSPQYQIPSSSVISEHKASTSSPSVNAMLGVSSSFESRSTVIGSASQSNASVSTSQKTILYSSDRSSRDVTSVPQHLNTEENGPTSSVSTHNTLHSTTGSQDYSKPSVFSQPSSTVLSQADAASSCTSSMSESRQLSSTENNYPLSYSDSPSGPSSSSVQVPSSSFGTPGNTLNSELLNNDRSSFSDCGTTSDHTNTVSGSTDSPIQHKSDSLLESSKVISADASSLNSHITKSQLDKTKMVPASSSNGNNTNLQKVTSGSSDKVTSASGDKVTSGNKVINENKADFDKGISTSEEPESDKGISTSGLSGENVSFEAEQVTSGCGNLSTKTCVTSVASSAISEKHTSAPAHKTTLSNSGQVTSSPESSENNVNSGRKEQSVSGSSDSDHVTSGTNITFGQACLSSETNNGNAALESSNITSGTNNVSSGSELSSNGNDSCNSNSRLVNSSGETKSSADCTNSALESDPQVTDSERSNVSSSLIKSDQNSLSGTDANYSDSVENSLHRKKINTFGEDANSPMKADSSSSSLKMKPLNSVSKDDNSCTSTIADLDTNCLKSKPKNQTGSIKSEADILDSKANSTVGDSASSEVQKDEDDAGPAPKKTKILKALETKDNLIEMESSEVKVEMEPGSSGSPLPANAAAQSKEEVDKKSSPRKKSVKCADTSTDLGSSEVSPGKCQKRKRSQSPVSSSPVEPRRSSRQPKSKFNVMEVLGIGMSADYGLEEQKPSIKQATHSPAAVANSSFSNNIKEEVMDTTEQQMEDMYNSFDSGQKFKEKIDLEQILAPFEQGWKREVVIRGVYEEFTKSGKPKRVPADVYYYAPDRRKLRSKVQIANYLTEHACDLTTDNFNFMRKPIYKEPFESVRNASRRSLPKPKSSPKRLPKPEVVLDIAQPEDGCHTTEEEEEDSASIEPEFEIALAATALTVQQVVPSHWASSGGCKEMVIKSEPMEIENVKTEAADEKVLALQTHGKHSSENSNSSGKKTKKTKSVARKSTSQLPKSLSLADVITNAEPFQPCSLSCPGLIGIPPTLHCDICMCLFHIACVNLKDNEVPKVFTCKNCSKDERLVRNKMTAKTTSITIPAAITTTPSVMITTTTTSSSSSTIIASKAIPASLISSLNSPTSNIVNTITDSTTSESDKKGNKVASKPSVIQSSSTKDISVVTHLPRKHVTVTRQVVLNTPLSMLNGSPVSSPTQVVAEDRSREVSMIQLAPDSSNHLTCGTQTLSNSVRPSIIPSRMKVNKTANTYSLLTKKSPTLSQPSSSLPLLLPKVNTSVIAAAASPSSSSSSSSSYNVSLKNNSVTTITTTPSSTSPPPPASSSSSSTTTTTTTTTSSSSAINITTMSTTTTDTTAHTNVTTSASIDCTKDLTVKNSVSLTPESPMIVSPSQLLAPPSQMSTSETTSSSSIKMETLSSSSPSSSSPSSSSLTSYAHSGSGVNSVVGLQVSNTLLGSESYPRSGQLLTLPSAVAKRLNPSLPLALRINNMQLLIPPSRCINTAEGLKVFLPPKTFSVPSGSTTTMNITFSSGSMSADNAKDLSLSVLNKDKSMSLDMCDQVVDLSKTAETSKQVLKVTERRNKMKSYLCPFKTLYTGYNTMIQIFSYLSAGDLVRCSLVCRTWRRLTTQASLWNAIHLENTRISDWARATQFFSRYLVEELSLRGMQYEDDWNRVWHQLTPVLEQLTTLKRLYFDHVPALMLYTVCQKLPQLEELGANMISDFTNEQQWTIPTKIDLAKFCSLKNLRKLQLRGTGGLASSFSSGISEMVTLKYLQHLSLTSMRSGGDHDLDYLGELKGLKVLEIGNCTNWTSETYFQLGKLVNLEKLRLEHGGEIPDVGLADALFNLKSLFQLELITFVIADTLHVTLSQLKNLRKFVVWPDTTQQAALVNSNTFVTVIKLPTLKQLEWGVTQNKNSSIILNEPRSVTTASNAIIGSDKDTGDKLALIPFLSPDAQELVNQTSNNNSQMLSSSSSEKFTEYIGMRQLGEKLKCLLTNTQVNVFRTLDDTSCVSSW